ncbi:GAF domain containing protein [Trichomonas vaginalis G3]|uniref:GAF domain containing protein n=1 Tax=Trichomonas vaginalis (strain ATCC PRA-98 / G3) TaxID=412133 RepID=A2F4K8_TRIV3|nr:3',5'-cyclic-nucleotide phosphodiesterase protein [Trichomonas vaginalis G3]EAY00164.1 GAF domain containing protein [Trichomonas vaginalis G3]KAI5541129.1 3',5'-cyclic-nucleotide phosphodiesterase protein [Trichomonas vaginalis G3]|eukprot:XP_001313093.1 GAF domain containing protein [Trichomonas vaginalis G3]
MFRKHARSREVSPHTYSKHVTPMIVASINSPQTPYILSPLKPLSRLIDKPVPKSQPRSPRDPSPEKERSRSVEKRNTSPPRVQDIINPKEEKVSIKESRLESMVKQDAEIDEYFIKLGSSKLLNEAIESFLEERISNSKVIFWEEIASLQLLYSFRMKRYSSHEGTTVGFAFSSRELVQIPHLKNHPSYNAEFDGQIANPDSRVVFFPLNDSSGNLIGIVQILLKVNDRLLESQINFINQFQKKFTAFSEWILSYTIPEQLIGEFSQLLEFEQFLVATQSRLHSLFRAKRVELWIYHRDTGKILRCTDKIEEINDKKKGFVGNAITKVQLIHTLDVMREQTYNVAVDGSEHEAVFVQPYDNQNDNRVYAVVLRGNMRDEIFSHRDEVLLKKIGPYVMTSYRNAEKFNNRKEKDFNPINSLTESLPKANQVKRGEVFLQSLMNALAQITKSERVLYFKVDHVAREVRSIYITGNEPPITYNLGQNHVGIVAETGQPINCSDAQKDKDADTVFDSVLSRQTKTILTIPIVSVDGKISAVIQLINRGDGEPFSKDDADMASVVGTICICLLENSQLLRGNIAMRASIDSAVKLINSIFTSKSTKEAFDAFTDLTKTVTNTSECIVYMLDKVSERLYDYFDIDKEVLPKEGPISECMKRCKPQFVNDVSKVSQPLFDKGITRLCCSPLLSNMSSPIGVVIITNGSIFTDVESNLLAHLCNIFSLYLQRLIKEKCIEEGPLKSDIDMLISVHERKAYSIPSIIKPTNEQSDEYKGIRFKAFSLDDADVMRILFFAFDNLGIMNSLKITAETVYSFISIFNSSFVEGVAFHNKLHSLDCIQFFMFMNQLGTLGQVLNVVEMHAILASIFCYSMKHDGTTDIYNEHANTINYRVFGPKVLSARARATLLDIYSKEGMLGEMSQNDKNYFWNVSTTLLQSIDPADIQPLINKLKEIVKTSLVDLTNTEHRLIIIELIFRAAIIGWTVRPFGISSRWQDLRAQESFALGEKENSQGLVYSSPMNSPDLYVRPKSAIDVLVNQSMPLFEALSLAFTEMKSLLDAAVENKNACEAEAEALNRQ